MITVVCPVYNEEEFIENVLKFFIEAKPDDKELIIVDGGSTDRTLEIILSWIKNYNNIKLLYNKNKFVPYALNLAIKNSKGDPIIRLDAHTIYEKNYLEKILETFEKTNADIVGGPMRKIGESDFQLAVAYATTSLFGIGDSKIHKIDYNGESDHVYLGAWRRRLFDEIGCFDEKLVRNQDDEFHYRAKSFGKKIYLSSEIVSYYYPRKTFWGLCKQYFQYGLYKPLVLKKIKSEIKLRHLIPALFTVYLILLPILIILSEFFIIPLLLYFLINLIFTLQNRGSFKQRFFTFIIYPIIHFAYGIGSILGIGKIFKKSF
ncbi:Glycosyltransferase [Ignavibacterium album JCM 16511]|uniref:Glycosyltransferase n=1 Tax=Ignavibacterium album (strain DSM 19864 / JCM 16511 / NBRC 101810 / Mat9-16) TaxID=945713 RepID=I0ALC4_IGNAJ|nr:glycosyltransferase family 2 protein [Ignavibacterium album]AFH49781.1 Glycosyltransferase [Ignavibacterium album JCM 16511]